MNYTEKHHLPQWEEDDLIRMQDFNQAMANLEKGLNETSSSLEKGLNDLSKGSLRVKTGEYTGDGQRGEEHPTRLEFDFKPLLLVVYNPNNGLSGGFPWTRGMVSGITYLLDQHSDTTTRVNLTWEDHAVQWYNPESVWVDSGQLNVKDTVYGYLALGVEE